MPIVFRWGNNYIFVNSFFVIHRNCKNNLIINLEVESSLLIHVFFDSNYFFYFNKCIDPLLGLRNTVALPPRTIASKKASYLTNYDVGIGTYYVFS